MFVNRMHYSKSSFFVLLVFLILAFHFSGIREFTDYSFIDFKFNDIKQENNHSNDIVIVGIDEKSISKIKEPLGLWHEQIEKFIQYALKNNAKQIIIDLGLPKKSYNFLVKDIDQKLFSALKEAEEKSNLIIASSFSKDGTKENELPIIISLIDNDSFGHPLIDTSSDGKIRKLPINKSNIRSISALAAKFFNVRIKKGLINYSLGEKFEYISFIDIAEGKADQFQNIDLENKIFMFGAILPFQDRMKTPISLLKDDHHKETSPGVLVHAQSIRTYLNNAVIYEIPLVICLIIGLVLAGVYFYIDSEKHNYHLYALPFVFLIIILSVYLQNTKNISLPVSTLCVSILLAVIVRMLLNSFINYEIKKKLTNSFSKYVSPTVMDKILDGEISPESSLVRKKVAVLFSDIRSFTARSEHEDPENIAILLNKYFQEMTSIVHKNRGTVDKFIGDGLMVFYGAPNELDNPALNAIDSAIEMNESVHKINETLQLDGIEPIRIGIGIHSGDAIIGHIGSRERYEYTAIGDVVNLAARLESKTKELGYEIVCSSSIENDLKGLKKLEYIGETPIKGRADERVFGLYKI